MESSSPLASRRRAAAWWAVGLAVQLGAAVAGLGCREVPKDDSTAEFVRPLRRNCTGPDGGTVDNMDTYIVEVYDVLRGDGGLKPTSDSNQDCLRCLQNPGTC